MIKKVNEMIKIIKHDGWVLYTQKGSHKQYKHPIKKGRVTIPDHGMSEVLAHDIVKSILKQAGLL
jgi:predicted RNA binding protein YcfA (HicA-like mRNA interferase family)